VSWIEAALFDWDKDAGAIDVSTFPIGGGPRVDRFVRCDASDCGLVWGVHGNEYAFDSHLREEGWGLDKEGKHLCPKCTKDAYDAYVRRFLGIDLGSPA
jgi:hypothetical protein